MSVEAKQGHLYRHNRARVIAMESGGQSVRVREVDPNSPWLGRAYMAPVKRLVPLPMRYFHGNVHR